MVPFCKTIFGLKNRIFDKFSQINTNKFSWILIYKYYIYYIYIILYIQTQITDKMESLFSNPRREHTKQCILYNVSRLLMSGNFRHEC